MTIESPHRLVAEVEPQIDRGCEIPSPQGAFQVAKGLVVARLARRRVGGVEELPLQGRQGLGLVADQQAVNELEKMIVLRLGQVEAQGTEKAFQGRRGPYNTGQHGEPPGGRKGPSQPHSMLEGPHALNCCSNMPSMTESFRQSPVLWREPQEAGMELCDSGSATPRVQPAPERGLWTRSDGSRTTGASRPGS